MAVFRRCQLIFLQNYGFMFSKIVFKFQKFDENCQIRGLSFLIRIWLYSTRYKTLSIPSLASADWLMTVLLYGKMIFPKIRNKKAPRVFCENGLFGWSKYLNPSGKSVMQHSAIWNFLGNFFK